MCSVSWGFTVEIYSESNSILTHCDSIKTCLYHWLPAGAFMLVYPHAWTTDQTVKGSVMSDSGHIYKVTQILWSRDTTTSCSHFSLELIIPNVQSSNKFKFISNFSTQLQVKIYSIPHRLLICIWLSKRSSNNLRLSLFQCTERDINFHSKTNEQK